MKMKFEKNSKLEKMKSTFHNELIFYKIFEN